MRLSFKISFVAFAILALCISIAYTGSYLLAKPLSKTTEPALSLWLELPGSKNSCPDYDYFPKGGIRNFFCHISSIPAYTRLLYKIPFSVYKSGPHKKKHLNLKAKYSFGHYNKKFVRWLTKTLIPDSASVLGNKGKVIYTKYIAPLATIHFVTYKKLKDNPAYLQKEIKWYKKQLQDKTLQAYFYEKYFFFMNKSFIKQQGNNDYFFKNGFDGGYSGNVVKTAVAFWIRRSIDGTAETFFEGLEKLMKLYSKKQ